MAKTSPPTNLIWKRHVLALSTASLHSRLCLARLKHSAWRILLGPLAWAFLASIGLTLASQFSGTLLAMDLAVNKGYPEQGLLIITVGCIASICGTTLSGIFGHFRNLPSFLLLAVCGVLGSMALFLLGSVSSLSATAASMFWSKHERWFYRHPVPRVFFFCIFPK